MTISVATAEQQYTGDDLTTSFPTVFVFSTSADIEVIERVIATGAETTQVLTTDYTVTGGGGAGATPATGTVEAVTAPASTVTWTIRRVVTETQGTALPVAGEFPSTSVEQGLDRTVMMVQQHSDELGRSLAFPKTDDSTLDPTIPSSVDRALKLLAFTANGTPTVRDLVDGGSGTMSDLVDDATPQLGGTLDANSKQVRLSKGADVASATALTLGTDGNYFDITGTTTITSIATLAAGSVVRLHFDGVLTLTHHATNLVLPGGANITTAEGDEFTFVEYAAGQWRCTGYALATGEAVVSASPSLVIQVTTATGAGTYTPTTDMAACIIFMSAGGGGGGGSGIIANKGGAGGGAGATAIGFFTAAQIGASKAFSIGAGGTAGTADGNGAAGGNSTFNTTDLVMSGGSGGVKGNTAAAGGQGGTASAGLIQLPGGDGGGPNNDTDLGSQGGASFWGGGGGGGTNESVGGDGNAPGSGGAGGATTDVTGSAGGTGADGIFVVIELIS